VPEHLLFAKPHFYLFHSTYSIAPQSRRNAMPTATRSGRSIQPSIAIPTAQASQETENGVQWEKVLWRKQPFPDNYVPPSFLAELNALRAYLFSIIMTDRPLMTSCPSATSVVYPYLWGSTGWTAFSGHCAVFGCFRWTFRGEYRARGGR